jgi:predicted ATP-grasp superfamily ATP-dependent carboligase
MMPPVVVLGGMGASLSITRSLARHGVRVHVLGEPGGLVAKSRSCAEFVDFGFEAGIQDRWMEWLGTGPRGAVLLPVGDDGVELIGRNRPRLEELGYVPVEADDEVMLAMLDKQRTRELADLVGTPTPATLPVRGPEDADAVAERIGFPCALKPLHSHLFARHFPVKVFTVGDERELGETLARTAAVGLEMIATEVIPGGDDRYRAYYTYLDQDGEPLFHFTKSKVRQHPIHFGLGTYFKTDWNPRVVEEGLRFCQAIGLRGLANLEFKLDPRDGVLKLIECNHRFTAVNEIVRQAGIDIATMVYDHLVGNPIARMPSYRSGVRLWSPLEDFKAAREYRAEGDLTYLGWALGLLHPQHTYFFEWRDPEPTLYSFGLKLKRRLVGADLARSRSTASTIKGSTASGR